jgi:methyl-accepting chemotaxis protein
MSTTAVTPVTQMVEQTSGIILASNVADVVIAVAILVMTLLALILFARVNAILKDVRKAAHQNLGPVSDRARAISDNVEFITQSLRTDVEKLNTSVRALTDRLQLASDRMEERIEEFNALMEVVQGEAEEVFLDTVSTVRGVREGARTITERASRPEAAAGDTTQHRSVPPSGADGRSDPSSEENAGAVHEP